MESYNGTKTAPIFLAACEASNFTKAAARLRVAQPALSRQVKDLEDEIGVDLLRRTPRGVRLTAEGKLYLEEVRELLKRTGESVEKIRALARDEYGEMRVGYMSTATVEILPPALAAFRKSVPHAEVLLYDLLSDDSSLDYEMPRWNSRSWSSQSTSGPQASSSNCYASTRCVSR
jgi:DNA-binding transcriptional LysR family regulator